MTPRRHASRGLGTTRPAAARRAGSAVSTAALIALLISASACTSGPGPVDDSKHHETTVALRAEKDVFFRTGRESPLLDADRAAFTALAYYDVDPVYRVPAWLTVDRSGPPLIIELQTSTNQKRRMRKVGALGFTLAGTPLKLTAFADSETQLDRLFVPFGDLTNNKETYGGGRYLDLVRTPTGIYDLDFNRAYHPYCVFNPTYDCPVPPYENRLLVSIPAGERLASPPKLRP